MKTLIEGPGRMRFYTDMGVLLEALDGWHRRFGWLLTECDVNSTLGLDRDYEDIRAPRLLSGADLDRMGEAATRVGFQVIWGVFSALLPGEPIDLDHLVSIPYADGNPALWDPDGGVQYPGAVAEIACWDSGAVVVTSDDEEIHRRVRAYFPEAGPMPRPPTSPLAR